MLLESHSLSPYVCTLCVSTCVAVSVDVLDVEEQQEQAQADEWCYCAAQQESVTALTVDHLQEEIHTHTHTLWVSKVKQLCNPQNQFIMAVCPLCSFGHRGRDAAPTLILLDKNTPLQASSQQCWNPLKLRCKSRSAAGFPFLFLLSNPVPHQWQPVIRYGEANINVAKEPYAETTLRKITEKDPDCESIGLNVNIIKWFSRKWQNVLQIQRAAAGSSLLCWHSSPGQLWHNL